MLLVCEWTRGIWFECCWGKRIENEGLTTFDEWLLKTCNEFKKEWRKELIIDVAFICWQIWKMRNEVVIGNKIVEIEIVIAKIRRVINEYHVKYNDDCNKIGTEKRWR